ncbi:PPOX class F420-dependent oxidoreductase [Dactylosporangium sp. NPDC049140]|jgi:PPOX class probable F420-dependent enzyme|uniref:PPOX class F420-dependent oxidoreductase n=1 Tax=Dactylosporangium sp. NPDC049140 TaxID=3155647 RepID=UPI0033C6EB58
MSAVEEIGRAGYVRLTTYRKDGTPVATPVWHALHDGEVFIVSNLDAWKVKRIRNNGQVELTPCNVRGTVKPGASTASGTARLLDEAGTAQARRYIAGKYFLSRAGNFFARVLRLRKPPVIGIAVTI